MRPPQRTFVVEYKTSRQTPARPASIWGNLDLQAFARQVEADGILPGIDQTDANAGIDGEVHLGVSSCSVAERVEAEDRSRASACQILTEEPTVCPQAVQDEPGEIEAPVSQDLPLLGGRDTRTSILRRAPARAASVSQRAAVKDHNDTLEQISDEEDLIALEAENRRLKRLVIVKLRHENERLQSMLRRFGLH